MLENQINENQKKAILEGLLFIAGDDGLEVNKMASILEISKKECLALLNELLVYYQENDASGLTISSFSDKFRLTTKKEYYKYYVKLFERKHDFKLSQAALETLAIIAYRGPICRHVIEDIRGVNCENVIYKLKSRDLIEDAGRSEDPGRPMLYKVTEEFMKVFSLRSLKDLPKINFTEQKQGEELFK